MSSTETRTTLTNRHMHVLRQLDTTMEELPGCCFSWARSELAACLRWGLVEARPSRLRKRRNVYRLTEHGRAMLAEECS